MFENNPLEYRPENNIERIQLEVMTESISRRISKQELLVANPQVESYMDFISQDLVVRLTARIAGKELQGVKFPSTWKEAFKERWFPKFLLKKYPVKYEEYNAKVLYPDIAIPEHQHYVQIYKYNG